MNRGEIRALARKNLGETTASFWTDAELNTYFDNAGYDVARRAKCIRTNNYTDTIAEQAEYTLSSIISNPVWVFEAYIKMDGTTWQELDLTNRTELNQLHQGWMSATSGTPTKFYWDYDEDLFGLYVKPNTSNAGSDYLRIFYAENYTPITSDSSTPAGIPFELQLAMVDFITAYGYIQRGWGDKGNDMWTKYYRRLQEYEALREDPDITMKNYRNIR